MFEFLGYPIAENMNKLVAIVIQRNHWEILNIAYLHKFEREQKAAKSFFATSILSTSISMQFIKLPISPFL